MPVRQALRKMVDLMYRASMMGFEKEHTFSRLGMYEALTTTTRGWQFEGPVLSISHSQKLLGVLGIDRVDAEANYPDVNILNLPFPDASFGVVASDQVFEHIKGLPSDAMRETLRVLKPGGWAIHTTCFHTPYHGPGDYWRFTPEGLEELARLCGAKVAIGGGHGHPIRSLTNYFGWVWTPVPKARWHPIHVLAKLNRPSYAYYVWVFAQK